MRAVSPDGIAWSVGLCPSACVCVCVGHVRDHCKNGWIDRDGVWSADSRWHREPRRPIDGIQIPKERGNFGVVPSCPTHWKAMGVFAAVDAKMAEPIEMPFGAWLTCGLKKHVLDGVKVGRIHSPLRGVTGWQCGVSSQFYDHWQKNKQIASVSSSAEHCGSYKYKEYTERCDKITVWGKLYDVTAL